MVGNLAAVCGEVIQPHAEGPGQIGKGADLDVADPAEFGQVVSKAMGVDVERLVRTPARQHLDVEAAVGRDGGVVADRRQDRPWCPPS